jgi:hypothetical protein
MPRVMIVVARDRPELLSYFERVFQGMADIKVQVDRRYAPPGRRARQATRCAGIFTTSSSSAAS